MEPAESCPHSNLVERFTLFVSSIHAEKVPMQYDYERLLKELGARVRKLRTERKWTHRQMIAEHGFHLNQLHKIEKGEPVSTQTLLRLCAAFDLKLSELVQGLAEDE